jgi:hypothetical protein
MLRITRNAIVLRLQLARWARLTSPLPILVAAAVADAPSQRDVIAVMVGGTNEPAGTTLGQAGFSS